MLGGLGGAPAATTPNAAATTTSCIIPNTNLLLLSSSAQIRTISSSSSLTYCSGRSSYLPHSSCRTLNVMAAAGETLTVTNPDSQSPRPVSGNRQALISLSDKKDLAVLGNGLQNLGYKIVSTGGTASALESAGLSVTKVEELACFPEMLDGRVKILHPNVHGAILARRDQTHHMEALSKHRIGTFDLVVVNLYPFYDIVTSTGGIVFEDRIENMDIGGPAMTRAAAKVVYLNGSSSILLFNNFIDHDS